MADRTFSAPKYCEARLPRRDNARGFFTFGVVDQGAHGEDHPHAIGARLTATIIGDDFEADALSLVQLVGVRDVFVDGRNCRGSGPK